MDENINPIKKRLSEQLPTHSPDPGSWQRMSAKLDALGAEAAFREKIEQLPQHSPDMDTWSKINLRLNRIGYYKTAKRIALAVAAGLLLFLSVSRVADYTQKPLGIPQVAEQIQIPSTKGAEAKIQLADIIIPQKHLPDNNLARTPKPSSTGSTNDIKIELPTENDAVAENIPIEETPIMEKSVVVDNLPERVADAYAADNFPVQEVISKENKTKSAGLPIEQTENPATSPVKYYTPKEPVSGGNHNHFAVAMNYLPENVNNGTDNSLFHNVDLTASYNKEKVRFNTSIGMAYNEEQLEFDMNYDVKTPVTAIGPGGHLDTLRYEVANVDSQYQGTEKHQYFTYNLGFGRRLFSFGKFSSWINAGAGFGIQVNNPDLIASTQNSIKGQYNAQIISVKSDKPVYNDVNVNLVTGIDLNYAILNKLSITLAPTGRWYFKSMLTKDNQPTDELTLGFRTGLKLDF
ncbi:MAG: hypothetical protein ACOYN4_12795 [Bacteroidales bacterium]